MSVIGGFESYDALKAYVTCFMLGVALLFAYNALLSTPMYFKDYYKFAQNDPEATTSHPDFWKNVVSTISLVSNIPNLVVQAVLLHPISRRVKQHTKLIVGLIFMAISLIMIPLVTVFKVSSEGSSAYLMAWIVACALGTGVYQSTALALVANFPPSYFGVCIVGVGVSGVISNVMGIITQAAMPDTYDGHDNQSKVFYSVAGAVIVITLIALFFFKYNPYAQRYVPEYRESAQARRSHSNNENAALLGKADQSPVNSNEGITNDTKTVDIGIAESTGTASVMSGSFGKEQTGNDNGADAVDSQAMFANTSTWGVFKTTMAMQLSVLLTFIITLFVMPSLALAIDPEAQWYPVLVITVFNVFDTVGRYIPNIQKLWMPRKALVIFAIARVLVIPLWFLSYKTNVITGYTYPYILMGVTGITNGYVGCLSMVYAPQTDGIDDDAKKNVSGNITSFMLLCGCAIGSVLGWLVTTYS